MEPVADRARNSPWPLMEVHEALAIIISECRRLDSIHIPVSKSLGFCISEDVRALEPHPAFRASIKDGYAVIASDGVGFRKVVGVNIAGADSEKSIPKVLNSGECARISTGSALLTGADSVVQLEDTDLIHKENEEEQAISIKVLPKLGQDIRAIGSDIERNESVVPNGTLIGSSEIGILSTVGCRDIMVTRKPKIAVISTGNEIVDIAEIGQLPFGMVRDSNRPALLALFASFGYEAEDFGIVNDRIDDIKYKIMEALNECDILVSSGGVSMGEKDLLKYVLETELGFHIHFGRVFMKPGKPSTFATGLVKGRSRFVFALPGNPVSAWVTAHLFVFPAIRTMAGHGNPLGTVIKVKLSSEIASLDSRPEYIRAFWAGYSDPESQVHSSGLPSMSDIPFAISTGHNQISSRMTTTKGANLLLKLPPKSDKIARLSRGEIVQAIVIGQL